MSQAAPVCWKCGESLHEVPQPLSRYAECLSCRSELHVCRMCEFYDVSVAQSCREPMAEEVKDKTRANFCEFFQPNPDAFQTGAPTGTSPDTAALEALFDGTAQPGAGDDSEDDKRRALDDLFGSGGSSQRKD